MLFITPLEQRLIIVSIVQCWPIFYNIFFAYKLLSRSKNRVTYSLCSFFIVNTIALVILLISIFTAPTALSYPFYILGYYLFFFSYSLLDIFIWLVLKVDKKVSVRLIIIMICAYSITCCFIFVVGVGFGGIQYSSSTGWVPVFTSYFAITSWVYILVLNLFPEILIGKNLIKAFQHSPIKRRIYLIVITIILGFAVLGFTILYNFLIDNNFYRSIHTFINLPLGTLSAFLLYRSLGKGLE